MEVIVVGAGIGGLGAALALARSGHVVTVLEQAPALKEVGAGIQVGANGCRILQQWGLLQKLLIRAEAAPFGRLGDGLTGRSLCNFPLSRFAESHYGFPHLHVHRADLLSVLLDACNQEDRFRLHTDARVVHIQQERGRVYCHTEGQTRLEADLLIGADGMRSRVAELMFKQAPAKFTGRVAWRALVRMSEIDTDMDPGVPGIWMAPGKHLVHYPIRGGSLLNLVACANSSERVLASWDNRSSAQGFLDNFGDLAANLRAMLAPLEESYLWGLYETSPQSWIKERVVLLGDSAHAMLPSMAQGAVMALEDAAVLDQLLQSGSARKVERMLHLYQGVRARRTSAVQEVARRNLQLFHAKGGAGRSLRNLGLSLLGAKAEGVIGRRYDWVYGFDACAEAARLVEQASD